MCSLCFVDEKSFYVGSVIKMATMCMLMILESSGTEFYFCHRHSNFFTRIILKWVSLYGETKQNFI